MRLPTSKRTQLLARQAAHRTGELARKRASAATGTQTRQHQRARQVAPTSGPSGIGERTWLRRASMAARESAVAHLGGHSKEARRDDPGAASDRRANSRSIRRMSRRESGGRQLAGQRARRASGSDSRRVAGQRMHGIQRSTREQAQADHMEEHGEEETDNFFPMTKFRFLPASLRGKTRFRFLEMISSVFFFFLH